MKNVICKQEKALKGRILSIIVLVFSLGLLFYELIPLHERIVFFLISTILVGYAVSYKIDKDFNNQKLFSVFGVTVFRMKLDLDFPDYISIFSASFSLDNEWGSISAIGTKERHDKIVVRFFTGNKNVTLYKTENYQNAVDKAKELSALLSVEVYNTIKK